MARTPLLLFATALACGPSLGDDDDGAGDGGGTAPPGSTSSPDDAGETTAPGTGTVDGTGTPPDPTGSEIPCGPSDCRCEPECESTEVCIDGVWECTCECPMDSGPPPRTCPTLDELLAEWTELSKGEPVDCGTAGPVFDPEEWALVHDCILDGLASATTLSARWSDPAGDPYEFAVSAREGAAYEVAWWEVSGFGTITEYSCSAVTSVPKCPEGEGPMCLVCEDQTATVTHCDPK